MLKTAVDHKTHSQCGGQGFDPPLLHQITYSPSITYKKHINEREKSFAVILTPLRGIFCAQHQSLLGPVCKKPNENDGCRRNPSELTPALRAVNAEVREFESALFRLGCETRACDAAKINAEVRFDPFSTKLPTIKHFVLSPPTSFSEGKLSKG